MTLSKKQKRWLIISGIIAGTLAVAIIIINLVLAGFLGKIITQALKDYPDKHYTITVDRVGVNILTGNVNLHGLQVEPDSLFIEQLKQEKLNQSMIIRMTVPLFRLAGLNLYKAIGDGDINIRKILFRNAKVQILKGKKKKQPKPPPGVQLEHEFTLDSIQIKGISNIQLVKLQFSNFKIEIINVETNETISKNESFNMVLKGGRLLKLPGEGDYFKLDNSNTLLELSEKEWLLPGGNYKLALGKLEMKFADSTVVIKRIVFKPQYSNLNKMAEKLKYTTGIFNAKVRQISLSKIYLNKLLSGGDLYIDSIAITGLDMDIYKDKRKPWDFDKRPKYPHEALRKMDFPLYIRVLTLGNKSKLVYHEKSEKEFGNLTITLGSMSAVAKHITSVKDSLRKPMSANLRAKVYNKVSMNVDFLLPLNSRVDTFFMSGSVGKADMRIFNPALYPAIGMKINKGTLNSLKFKTRANRWYIDGEMVMTYEGLETEFFKKKAKETNKFMSWLTSSIAHKSNPGKNEKLRTAKTHFDRDMYKGFVNIAWKAIQTGLINTISGFGKTVKEDKYGNKKKSSAKKSKTSKQSAAGREKAAAKDKKKKRRKKGKNK